MQFTTKICFVYALHFFHWCNDELLSFLLSIVAQLYYTVFNTEQPRPVSGLPAGSSRCKINRLLMETMKIDNESFVTFIASSIFSS